jgi:DNA-binding NarL/FixJ family response regulator
MKIRIAIADDHLLFREGLSALLKENENLVLKYQASDGLELLEKFGCLKSPVDVLLLDIKMPNMDGIEVLKRLKITRPEIKTIMLTMYNEDSLVQQLVELGAKGFVPKHSGFEAVQDAIYKVFENDIYFSEDIYKRLIKRMANKEGMRYDVPALTEKEIEVVKLLCKEYSAKEISNLLYLSERTVDTHKKNIFAKVGAKNIVGVVLFAMKNGIVG